MKTSTDKKIRSDIINDFFEKEDWNKARQIILKELKKDPENHWLLTRLSTSYYEEHNYEKALDASLKAIEIKPNCPLVLWDLASALDMLSREIEAIRIWKNLLRRGDSKIAYDECGEGKKWAESLLNDCRYRIANSYQRINQTALSRRYILLHLEHRKSGLPSLYSISNARKLLRQVS